MPPASASATTRDPTAWQLAGVPRGVALPEAEAFCRRIARRHYENFTVATRLVPPHLRQHLANVYAFARWSDDLADEPPSRPAAASAGGDARLAALAQWRRLLEDCFAGRPDHPVFIALADTVRCTGVTMEPFADLLDAFEEDVRFDLAGVRVRYEDREAVARYCRCTGLQLVNVWQDLRRDRLAGRVYLPRSDMERHGVSEAMLDEPVAAPPLRALVATEVAWARERFDRGAPLVDAAPPALRPAIGLFLAGGRAVASAIERADHDTLVRRPVVGRWTKARLAARAWWDVVRVGRDRAPSGGHGGRRG
jgi:phytoene/squalene synthetase